MERCCDSQSLFIIHAKGLSGNTEDFYDHIFGDVIQLMDGFLKLTLVSQKYFAVVPVSKMLQCKLVIEDKHLRDAASR